MENGLKEMEKNTYLRETQSLSRPGRVTLAVAGALGLLTLLALPHQASAVLSPSTAEMQGRVPAIVGTPEYILRHNGNVIRNNDAISSNVKLNDITVDVSSTGTTITDLDGDCDSLSTPCTLSLDASTASLIWKYKGIVLNDANKNKAISEIISSSERVGSAEFTVDVDASVQAASLTGIPRVSNPVSSSSNLKIFSVPPIHLSTVSPSYLYRDAPFPRNGFIHPASGKRNTMSIRSYILSSGDLSNNFTWSVDQPWLAFAAYPIYELSIVAKPTSATKTFTITGTSKTNPTVKTQYTSTIENWFYVHDTSVTTYSEAVAICSAPGRRLPTVAELIGSAAGKVGPDSPTPRGLISEWGGVVNIIASGTDSRTIWTSELTGPNTVMVIENVNARKIDVYSTTAYVPNGIAVCKEEI